MSMLALIPTNATEIKTDNSDTTTSFYAVKDKNGVHYYGPTGNNLTDKEDVDATHTYEESGTYRVQINGVLERIDTRNYRLYILL